MKYWHKNWGFTLEPKDGSVEITDERWMELLRGQEEGRIIQDDGEGYPAALENRLSLERLAVNVRQERDQRIEAVEWRVRRYQDEEILALQHTDDRTALARYIQALRDVPSQDGFPTNIIWPILEVSE
ncbi:MAG: hypothetical protein CVV52_10360 [Spirochaetae bacterium HGW-Spirochaetae-8]|jgi:hypothetical protein|nr:MAG: hypothetical protein CVV52_10360 [Spirochaetae bacterium HGW-Spirochaetae-8]